MVPYRAFRILVSYSCTSASISQMTFFLNCRFKFTVHFRLALAVDVLGISFQKPANQPLVILAVSFFTGCIFHLVVALIPLERLVVLFLIVLGVARYYLGWRNSH